MPETPAPERPSRVDPRRYALLTLVVVGLAALVVGFVELARGPVAVGWFLYAPMSEGRVSINRVWRWAPYLMAAGALVLGGAAGYALGRRRPRG